MLLNNINSRHEKRYDSVTKNFSFVFVTKTNFFEIGWIVLSFFNDRTIFKVIVLSLGF